MASFLLSLALLGGHASADAAQTNPLSKVLDLLTGLTAKIVAEGEKEAKAYKEYFDWCDDFSKSKGFEIKTLTAKKEKLMAEIAELTGSIASLTSEIEGLSAEIAADESELKDATLIREKEHGEFLANEADLVETIDTLTRAISILSKEMAKNPAAFAQLQSSSSIANVVQAMGAVVDAAGFSGHDKQKLMSLVQSSEKSDDDDEDVNAPAAAVYKTHSTGIFDLLEDLKEKAEEELSALRKAETNTKHNFEMLKQSLEDSIGADTKAKDEAAAAKAEAEGGKATAEGDLAMTEKALDDAKMALAEANTGCMQVAADHETTVTGRTEELTALAQAKKILEETSSGAVEQAYSLLQVKAGSQMRSRTDLANAELLNLVKKLARQHHSSALAQLASRIQAVFKYSQSTGDDPFVKVKGLIVDLINKLEAEAAAAATEKAWCDEQMAKTEEKKQELDEDIEKLTTKIDKASADSAQLKDEVKVLQSELAALAKLQAEMDSIRAEEHANFETAKADLTLGLEGVRKALMVLRDYYGASASSALLQQPAKPELFAKASGAGGGIIDILEVCESDFASNLAKAEKEESDAQTEYDKLTQENAVTKTLKLQDVKYKTQEFTGLDKAISDMSADLATEKTEHAAVMEYYGKVKDRCIAVPETYEERKARREAEIG